MIDTKIIDGGGSSQALHINPEGAVGVVIHPHPPIDDVLKTTPFREFFTDSNGSNDMLVNGVVTPISFSIRANENYDIYIKTISVNIGDDGTPALNRFGAIVGGLVNGIEWTYFNQNDGKYILDGAIKTNLDFIRVGIATAGIGTGVDAFLADVSGGGTEKNYLPTIDLTKTFGDIYGLKLKKGTNDRLTFTVNDDITSLLTLNAIAFGTRF